MAIQTGNGTGNSNSTFVQMSSILGCLFVASNNAAEIVKNAIGNVQGQRFDGYEKGSFTTTKRKEVADAGVQLILGRKEDNPGITGVISSVSFREVETADGKKYPYLAVTLKDGDESVVLSVNLSTTAAQVLVRKLANAKPGTMTLINAFSSLSKSETNGQMYAETNALLKQGGVEVKGDTAADTFAPAIKAAIQKLRDAGIDDNAVLSGKRQSMAVDYHKNLLINTVVPKFGASSESEEDAPAENFAGDDSGSDEIPF